MAPIKEVHRNLLHIIVVGAGLGGLSAAIASRLAGHTVTICEQALVLGEVGAGIQIPPNSARILERYGVLHEIKKLSVLPHAFILRSYKGKELNRQPMLPYCQDSYGAPYLQIHRADFHKVLVDKAQELGVEIMLNAHVNRIDFSAPSVALSMGKVLHCDLVVAADGLKSKCRELYLGHPDPPHNTGDLAYRILVKAEDIRKDPALAELTKAPMINYWMGPGSHAVCYPLKGGELYNIVLISPDNLPPGVAQQEADLDELTQIFNTWDPRLQKLLGLVQQTFKWKLQNSEEMESWVHPEGRFCLLGDACHATLPYLAQGAAQAVEDGAVLGQLLSRVGADDSLRPVLDTYERLRKKRTTVVVQGSTALQNIFHMRDGPVQEERDRVLLEDRPEEGFPNRWRDPVFQRWLFGYDAFAEAEGAWAGEELGGRYESRKGERRGSRL